RRRHTRFSRDWSSDVCSSDLPFEVARAELATDRALEAARSRINAETRLIDDLIAGGASLEEIAAETIMDLGTVELNSETSEGIRSEERRVGKECRWRCGSCRA